MVISIAISAIGAFLAFFWQSDTQCEEYFIILYIRCLYWILTFVSSSTYQKHKQVHDSIIKFLLNIFSYTIT